MSKESKGSKSGLSFVWGLATGALIGSISALLFAPKKGSELRGDIKEGAVKAVEVSGQALQTVKEKAVEVGKIVEAKTVELVSEAKHGLQKITKQETKAQAEQSIQLAETVEEVDVQEEAIGA